MSSTSGNLLAGGRESGGAADPLVEAKHAAQDRFPRLKNRALAQAADALSSGRIDIAEPLVTEFLAKQPNNPDAFNLMADIARRASRFEEAEHLMAQCVERAPESTAYRFNYAVILRRRDKYEAALAELDGLLSADLQNVLYREQKATVLRLLGRHAEALDYRRGLVEEFPASARANLHYAHALRGLGAQRESIAAYRKAAELAPELTEVFAHLANLKTYRFSEVEIARMEAQLKKADLGTAGRADVHFALGKAYGDEKAYAKSFDNYAKGNALRRIGIDFDPERLTAFRKSCEVLFTEAFFRERAGWGCDSPAPIFIVGMPRSGSTLIEQILSSHSAVEALDESTELDVAVGQEFSRIEGRPPHHFWIGGWFEFRRGLVEAFSRVVSGLNDAEARALGEQYLKMMARRRKLARQHFTDKELRNFGYIGLIQLILPRAKIIDARRHPLDSGWSCFKTDFPRGQPFANRLSDIGRHYGNYIHLMAHFDRVLPGRVHRVIYEHLVADPEREVRRMLDYVGLPFEENCLRFHQNRRAVGTLSSEQVRMPLYKTGVAQWRPYEPWLGPLKAALGPVLDSYPQAPD
jgi:tetratricopeptide (TPR) repeat protein